MNKQYHILNGDVLKEQFPISIKGDLIVMRECLVDGEVKSDSLSELYKLRAKFISENYEHCSIKEYYTESVSEFEKIQNIPSESDINLWFEDDLFCQVNFWFTAFLLLEKSEDLKIYLIRPPNHTPYGFGALNQDELTSAYEARTPLLKMHDLAQLWTYYQQNELDKLLEKAKVFEDEFPFIENAVKAHLDRIPGEKSLGRPEQTLKDILNELENPSFAVIFKEFSKRESIYGFGDLQVKRLLDGISENS